MNKLIKKFIAAEKHKATLLKNFYKNKFNDLLDVIAKKLSPGETINNEDLLYIPEKYPWITNKQLNDIFQCLDIYADIKWIQAPGLKFPLEECRLKGLIFTRIYGQGTALIITKPKTSKKK